jgi:UDP-2,3-diacylglucosamine pyrophosphatase LpxH
MYSPGNHDSFLRRLNGGELGNTLIDHSFEHFSPTGERLLVVHGDLFDSTITKYHSIAYVFAWMYELTMMLNSRVNTRRERRDQRPVDFCSVLKRVCKLVVKGTTSYEDTLVEHALEMGFSGVICGHVHRPRLDVLENGFIYANCGDWVEHCTALVEHHDGRLELIWWKEFEGRLSESPPAIYNQSRWPSQLA